MDIIRAWKDDTSLTAPLAVERLPPLTLHQACTGGRAADALARLGGGCRCRGVDNRVGARRRWKTPYDVPTTRLRATFVQHVSALCMRHIDHMALRVLLHQPPLRCDVCPPQLVVGSGQPLPGMHVTQQRLGLFINTPPPRVHQDPTPMHRGKPTMVLCTNHTTHSGYLEVSWVIAMYCSTPTPHAHPLALAAHWYAAWFQ